MTKKSKFLIITTLLSAIAIGMIVIGITLKIPAPALTGVGFLLVVWAIHELK